MMERARGRSKIIFLQHVYLSSVNREKENKIKKGTSNFWEMWSYFLRTQVPASQLILMMGFDSDIPILHFTMLDF